jgi:hypothetical protein
MTTPRQAMQPDHSQPGYLAIRATRSKTLQE